MAEERPTGTSLTYTFKSVSETEIQNKEMAALMGEVDEESPNTLPGGLISKLGLTDAKLFHAKSKKRDKNFRNWLWREAIQRSLEHINDIIKDLQVRTEGLLERMAETEEELVKLDEQHEILEAELEFFQEQGLFDCDEEGKLKNPEAEAIVAAWEKEDGQTIDRTAPTSYELILKILVEIDGQRTALRKILNRDAFEYEARKRQLDEALQIRDGLQSRDPALNQEALAKLDGFMDGVEENHGPFINEENEYSIERNSEPLAIDNGKPERLDDEFAFGFPPISDNFAHAASNGEKPPNECTAKPPAKTGSVPVAKQGN